MRMRKMAKSDKICNDGFTKRRFLFRFVPLVPSQRDGTKIRLVGAISL